MAMNIDDFVRKTQDLIVKERDAEITATKILNENVAPKLLVQRGVCLLNLQIASRHMGLYGRTVIAFEPVKLMPSHSFSPGDIVGLSLMSSDGPADSIGSGIVSHVTQQSVSIAFEESNESLFDLDDAAQYKIIKLANDVTYRRMQRALESLRDGRANGQLVNVLFGISDISIPLSLPEFTFINANLDDSQREAVKFALSQREVAVVHGPPGTGKTTTVTEIIQQAVRMGLKVLACAPSNVAVDNLVEKLSCRGLTKIVRLGHPARLLPTIQRYSLDAIVSGSDETKLVEDVRSDINKILGQMRKVRDRGDRQRLREDMKSLRRELRQRESAAVSDILSRAMVVLATLTTASEDGPLSALGQKMFDIVVIDECSQAIEAACWIALLRGNRCILAGDHHQLPPTILSESAAKEGLSVTLMERMLDRYSNNKNSIVRMLTTQYRMHDDIMKWSSEQMYDGRLVSHPSVAAHLLKDLSGVSETENTAVAVLLIDTAGCELNELDLIDNESKGNEGEADIVAMHVNKLTSAGVPPKDIAVISPYNLQVELLRLRLLPTYPNLEIKSVDGFQGREKEAVVLSLVRSNEKGEVGFLAEDRRINVAVTRARRHLAVVCDTDTVTKHQFIKSLVDHMVDCGEVRSAEVYIQDGALSNASTVQRPESIQSIRSSTATSASAVSKKNVKGNVKKPTSVGKTGVRADSNNTTADKCNGPRESSSSSSSQDTNSNRARETWNSVIVDFINDQSRSVHVFPPSLSSYDRMLVHDICNEYDLAHCSKGEGAERCIEIQKKTASSDRCENGEHKKPDSRTSDQSRLENSRSTESTAEPIANDDTRQSPVAPPAEKAKLQSDPSTRLCKDCGHEIPESNWLLHSSRCRPSAAAATNSSSVVSQVTSSTKQKNSKKSAGAKKNAGAATAGATGSIDVVAKKLSSTELTEDNFDAVLAAVSRADRTCSSPRCKNSTATLGQTCAFCRRTFCLTHHIAEVHGCGDEARRQARATIAREGQLYSGSGVPNKKPDATKRAQLESKLSHRLNDMADKRKRKQKDDKS